MFLCQVDSFLQVIVSLSVLPLTLKKDSVASFCCWNVVHVLAGICSLLSNRFTAAEQALANITTGPLHAFSLYLTGQYDNVNDNKIVENQDPRLYGALVVLTWLKPPLFQSLYTNWTHWTVINKLYCSSNVEIS